NGCDMRTLTYNGFTISPQRQHFISVERNIKVRGPLEPVDKVHRFHGELPAVVPDFANVRNGARKARRCKYWNAQQHVSGTPRVIIGDKVYPVIHKTDIQSDIHLFAKFPSEVLICQGVKPHAIRQGSTEDIGVA